MDDLGTIVGLQSVAQMLLPEFEIAPYSGGIKVRKMDAHIHSSIDVTYEGAWFCHFITPSWLGGQEEATLDQHRMAAKVAAALMLSPPEKYRWWDRTPCPHCHRRGPA